MALALAVRNVSMTFDLPAGPLAALTDIDLALQPGEFVAIIGPSGCGKSTLLRLIADILKPTSGAIAIGGEPPDVARRRHQIGFVFQAPTLLPWRTVRDNIRLPLDVAGATHAALSPDELIRLVGLSGCHCPIAVPPKNPGGGGLKPSLARHASTARAAACP